MKRWTRPDPRSTATAEPGVRKGAALLAAGALYAAAELGLAIAVGFFNWGRAEALLFHSLRPWLLIVAAVLLAGRPLGRRAIFFVSALFLAGLSQAIFLASLGSSAPWLEAVRGALGGLLVAAVADALVQLGRHFMGRWGGGLAAAASALLFLVPGVLWPYQWIVASAGERAASDKPDLMLLTALPLGWSEQGPLDPKGKPAASYSKLEREFAIRPIDLLDESSLARGRLLLLAQPRALAPEEFAALDAWVRGGGRVLILTDPALFWPSDLPIGDIRRAPAIGLLGPLLVHWGLLLERPLEPELVVEDVPSGGETRRLAMFAPGRFIVRGGACRTNRLPQIARCRIGQGEAILIADADMLHDRLWVGPGAQGGERAARLADNPLIIADLLDANGGIERKRAEPPVQWLRRDADRGRALLLAFIPLLISATPAAAAALKRRR